MSTNRMNLSVGWRKSKKRSPNIPRNQEPSRSQVADRPDSRLPQLRRVMTPKKLVGDVKEGATQGVNTVIGPRIFALNVGKTISSLVIALARRETTDRPGPTRLKPGPLCSTNEGAKDFYSGQDWKHQSQSTCGPGFCLFICK